MASASGQFMTQPAVSRSIAELERALGVSLLDRNAQGVSPTLADPKMKARFADLGGTVLPGLPADFGKLIGV